MMRILHLAGWYPSRLRPLEGIFVLNQVEAVSVECSSCVLYITFDPSLTGSWFRIESTTDRGVATVRVFLKSSRLRIPFVSRLLTGLRYLSALIVGLTRAYRILGRPDLIHVHVATRLGLVAVAYRILFAVPYIISEHSTRFLSFHNHDEYRNGTPMIIRWMETRIFRSANFVISVSDVLAERLADIFQFRGQGVVIPNVVRFPSELPQRNPPRDTISILTVSNLNIEHKGLDDLLIAFHRALAGRPALQLHIVGDGNDKDVLLSESKRLGILDTKVFFHGFVSPEHLTEYFTRAHFFVLNSRIETFSVATAEALAHGVPVLVTRSGGPEEFVGVEQGILIDPNDTDALVQGLLYLSDHWTDYDSAKLSRDIRKRCGSAIVGKRLSSLYSALTHSGHSHSRESQ